MPKNRKVAIRKGGGGLLWKNPLSKCIASMQQLAVQSCCPAPSAFSRPPNRVAPSLPLSPSHKCTITSPLARSHILVDKTFEKRIQSIFEIERERVCLELPLAA